jgi:predicted outer membrane repeat protein
MKKLLVLVICCLASVVFVAGGTRGADFHVTTAADFQTALTTAQNNGANDTIYLGEGVYTYGTAFVYVASATEDYALTIQAESGLSRYQVVLDGEGSWPVLRLYTGTDTFTNSHFTVTGITVRNGSYSSYGGGIYINTDGGDITVEDCVLANNITTSRGGGVYAETRGGDILLTGNRFVGNSGEGGAAFIYTPDTATVVDNVILDNSSESNGGGIYSQATHNIVERNLIAGNQAGSGKAGGGLRILPGTSGATSTLVNNVIINNAALVGSGVYISNTDSSQTYVINNTISDNKAPSGQGGGLFVSAPSTGELHVYNNIIWGNTAFLASDIYLSGTFTANGYNNNYDLDPGGMYGSWNTGGGTNIDVNPDFVDPDNGDYRLRSSSPCKDAGHDAAPSIPSTDFEGDTRIIDTHIDIGADEVSIVTVCVTTTPGDLQSVLTAAQISGKGDVIMVQQGVYTGNFTYSSSQGNNITLLGGYTSGCASRVANPANTTLDGSGSGQVLLLSDSAGGDILVDGFTVQNGSVSGVGGGVYALSTSSGAAGDITLRNNIITGSSAATHGGGLYAYSCSNGSGAAGTITLLNNTITGNSAANYGGGIIAVSDSTSGAAGTITLTNNTVTGNSADYGGGVYFYLDGTSGGFINAYNNIVWGNTATTAGGDVYLYKGTGTASAYYNDGHDSAGNDWDYGGPTNIDLDPLFVGDGNYHLRPGSPCINAGTDTAPGLPATDFEGDDRVIGSAPDIGADEFVPKIIVDFDGDGNTDIPWRHKTSGQNAVWLMNGTTWSSTVSLPAVADTNWKIVGDGDFNNDGKTDILWRHKTDGRNAVWLMNGTTWSSTVSLPTVADTNWEMVGAGDFNKDDKVDILWRYKTDGRNAVWLMNETTWSSTVSLPAVADTNWEMVGAGDFNKDDKVDILWRHKTTGKNAIWLMNGTTWNSTVSLPAVADNNWEIVGP